MDWLRTLVDLAEDLEFGPQTYMAAQPPITQALGKLTSSGLHTHLHACSIHKYAKALTHIHQLKIFKVNYFLKSVVLESFNLS